MQKNQAESPFKKPLGNKTYEEALQAIKSGEFFKWELAKQKTSLQARNHHHETLVHFLAKTQNLTPITHLLTEELLTQKNIYQISPLHHISQTPNFAQVPPHLLNKNTLLKKGFRKNTALHLLAQYHNLHLLPLNIFKTPEVFVLKNEQDLTPLHWAAYHGQLHLLPPAIFTATHLLHPDKWGNTPFSNATHHNHLHQLKNKLSPKTLTDLLKNPNTPKEALPFLSNEIQNQKKFLKKLKSLQQTPTENPKNLE